MLGLSQGGLRYQGPSYRGLGSKDYVLLARQPLHVLTLCSGPAQQG